MVGQRVDYERHGRTYARHRRADPRIAARIHAALGRARTVLNVGAGTGSYEPRDRWVLAVEPSATMRAQRPPGAAAAIAASAESLPLDDDAVDAAMACVTIHHWDRPERGLAELRRVARGPVVVFTFELEQLPAWQREYLREGLEAELPRFPTLEAIAAALGGRTRVERIPTPADCADGFFEAFWRRPERLLDPAVRGAQSMWPLLADGVEQRIVERLEQGLRSGAWEREHGHLRALEQFDGALRLVVSEPTGQVDSAPCISEDGAPRFMRQLVPKITAPAPEPGDDVDRFALLASALAGRRLAVRRAADGEPTHTDGLTVYLCPAAAREDDLDALAVQAALLAAGSLSRELLDGLGSRPRVARRYLALEGWRALAELQPLLPRLSVLARAAQAPTTTSSPQESLAVARGRDPLPDPPDLFGEIRPRALLARTPEPLEEVDLLQQEQARADSAEEEAQSEAEMLSQPVKPAQSRLSRWLKKLVGDEGTGGEDSRGVSLLLDAGIVVNRASAGARLVELPISLLPTEAPGEQRGWRYPEWDEGAGRYRPDWCTVNEIDPRPEDVVPHEWSYAGADLRRRLARLGVGLERRRRQPQGDDLDLDAVVEARVEMLRGSSPHEDLYIESQRRRRSLAVLVLLDVSGSAAEKAPRHGDVHGHQQYASALLLDALHGLGDRVAAYGFRSHGRGEVELLRVKSFEDHLDRGVHDRLAALRCGGYTRLGAAIRHGAQVLDTRAGTDRRLLLVLSDGFAYDDGYEGRRGEADARRALAETRRRGICCLCLSLGDTTDAESLQRVFGTAAHAAAEQFEDLLGDLGLLFKAALASADLQRRLAQRGPAALVA